MIYLLRHGHLEQVTPRRMVGQRDLPLTALGREQGAAWGRRLAGVEFARVCASPLGRTREMARLVWGERPPTVQYRPELLEIDLGEWSGLTREEIAAAWPGAWEQRGEDLGGFRPPGGESFGDVATRVAPLWEELTAAPPEENSLVVSHNGVIRVLVCAVLGLDLANLWNFELDYASLTLVARPRHSWHLHALNLPLDYPALLS
ncbi:MAG: histidine phosphatase family protein [Deltaproteobacteria bacterium]|nr:histidine phosphatase family protein [Deltaproteobacteria bacterium]MCB2186309.1 histidine phosphatase family protein [Deltaproteobacteria bacterium]